MARKPRQSKGKQMVPNFFVFCEGDTEVAYVQLLRSTYRRPIHIIAKKTLLNITPELVSRIKANYVETKADQTFLMYDLDVESVLPRLQKIPRTTLLCSNPCLELWFLLHYADQTTSITSQECVAKLKKLDGGYIKGKLQVSETIFLVKHLSEAVKRAKELSLYSNPSTAFYLLIEAIQAY